MPEQPPVDALKRAVAQARAETGSSKVLKVLYLDEAGEPTGEWHSSQLPEDLFEGKHIQGLQDPPYSMEQMVFLAEQHPIHSAALEQKTADIVGRGWEWESQEEDLQDPAPREDIEDWFEALAPEELDMKEVLNATWLDTETTGWGLMECVRENGDPLGEVKRLYHVPAHTVRAHGSGFKLIQIRGNKRVWFRRWGATDNAGQRVEVDQKTGSMTTVTTPANDLFIIKKPARRSTWYGIPGYVSAIGWITLALAARDDNLYLFQNRREPRWAIIMSNLADGEGTLEEDIRRAFTVDLKSPHRNIIIPITGPGTIDFQKLSADLKMDGSFDKLSEFANRMILVAHRTPPERVANAAVGALGGNIVEATSRVYKDGVVTAGQEVINSRLNNFLRVEYYERNNQTPLWRIGMDDLDVETDQEEADLLINKFKADLLSLGEAREVLKLGPLMKQDLDPETGEPTGDPKESPLNEKIYTELPGVAKGGAPGDGGGPPSDLSPDGTPPPLGDAVAARKAYRTAATLETEVREMLTDSREVLDGLRDLPDDE